MLAFGVVCLIDATTASPDSVLRAHRYIHAVQAFSQWMFHLSLATLEQEPQGLHSAYLDCAKQGRVPSRHQYLNFLL